MPLQTSLGFLLWWSRGSKEPHERANASAQAFLKTVFVSHLLLSHWPKQVTWPSPESVWAGIIQGNGYYGD